MMRTCRKFRVFMAIAVAVTMTVTGTRARYSGPAATFAGAG
jgi:hypothetical protein